MVNLVDVSRKPLWSEVKLVNEGDVLMNSGNMVGVVYKVDSSVHVCRTDLAGVMYSRTYSPGFLRAEVSRPVPIADPSVSNEDFNRAESIYVRSTKFLEEVAA